MNASDPRIVLTVIAAVAAGAALYLCWLRIRGMPRPRMAVLLGLRALLLSLVLLAVLSPQIRRTFTAARPAPLMVLVDTSQSMMELPTEGTSRYDEAVAALLQGPLAEALQRGAVNWLLAGDGVSPVEALPEVPDALPRTDLQAALSAALRREHGRPPVACLLVSDGADGTNRPPARVAEALGAYKVPVYCLGVGSSDPVADVAIAGVVAPETVSEGERFELRALVRAAGLEQSPVTLIAREDGRDLRTLTLEPGQAERRAVVELTAGAPGYHRYVLEARAEATEATAANNRRSVVVRVEPAEARLVWIEGSPRREYAFLRRLLLRVEELEPAILLRKRRPAEFWRDEGQPAAGSLSGVGELRRYRAVVLSNINAGALGSAFVEQLAEYVAGGGALAMLGGPDAFGAGGWAGTAVAETLPVRIAPGEGLLADGLSVTLSGDSELARALRESGIEQWERLPLLQGMNAVGGIRGGGQVVLQSVADAAPVVAVARHGAGRSLAVTVDDTWRWQQSPSADDHSRAAWEALWTGVLGWLIAPRSEREVVLDTGRDVWESGQIARAEIYVTDEEMRPLSDATVRLEIDGPDGEQTHLAEATATPGAWMVTLQAGLPGEYRLRAIAERGGEMLGEDARSVEVVEAVGELLHAARPEVLEAIAEATGGSYLPLERAEEMAEVLPLEPLTQERTVVLQPTRTIAFFVLLLLTAGADWLLRRRWGVG